MIKYYKIRNDLKFKKMEKVRKSVLDVSKFFLALFIMVFFIQCRVEIKQGTDDYTITIYRWFSQDFKKLQETGGEWFLYFDAQLTCNTCKLDILSKIREGSNLWVVTRFDSDIKLDAFKKAYKLDNKILNLAPDQKNQLGIPFLFQLDGKTMKDLVILDDETLAKGEWQEFFFKTN